MGSQEKSAGKHGVDVTHIEKSVTVLVNEAATAREALPMQQDSKIIAGAKGAVASGVSTAVTTPLKRAMVLAAQGEKDVLRKSFDNYLYLFRVGVPQKLLSGFIFMLSAELYVPSLKGRVALGESLGYAFAGATETFLMAPVETAMTRIQSKKDKTVLQAMKNIVKEKGFAGLYKGSPSAVISSMIYSSMFFPIQKTVRTLIEGTYMEPEEKQLSVQRAQSKARAIGNGLFSGLLAVVPVIMVTHPMSVISTDQRGQSSGAEKSFFQTGTARFQKGFAEGGISRGVAALYKGVGFNLAKSMFGAAAIVATLAGLDSFFGKGR